MGDRRGSFQIDTGVVGVVKGVVMGCARYGQSPNLTKIRRNKRAKSQISQSAVRIAGEKDMSFLEDDALDTGK